MHKAVRIFIALPGVMMLFTAIQWLIVPKNAAEGLGMPLLDGVARSTQIGDLGAFFFATAAMIGLGVLRSDAQWLHGAALLLGGAAVMRTAAWMLHGADFAAQFIVAELVMTAILLFGASRLDAPGPAPG